jgi:isopenicillin N synthase-like dioxygenase
MVAKITRELMRLGSELRPSIYNDNQQIFAEYFSTCHSITLELLACLSDALHLNGRARFESYHRDYTPANCAMSILRYPKSCPGDKYFGQNKHTDNGSLTLLLTDQPGLEMLSPVTKQWAVVKPKNNHAVINVGDTLRFLSGGNFRSAVHRAVPVFAPNWEDRITVAYFLRAEDGARITNNEGITMTAREWHDRKYCHYKEPHVVQRANSILMGGVEKDGDF